MPKKLTTYFNSICKTLAQRAETAGILAGRGDIGRCREIISQDFFQKHVSPRFSINLGGEVFGLPEECSGQIDIIINHDMSAVFKENAIIRCPIESVIAAVSVKSYLDKSQLYDALKNLSSIPQLDPDVLQLGPLTKTFSEYVISWPSLFLFAFDGSSAETCMHNILEFYKAHPEVPANRMPRLIIVNGKYAITHLHYDKPGHFTCCLLTAENMGSSLFWMINEITKGLSWLNGMYLDFGKYYQAAYLQ